MICEKNALTESLVFQGLASSLFQSLLQQDKPLIAIFNLRYIIKNNPKILITNPTIFYNIKNTYKTLLNSFFAKPFTLENLKDNAEDPQKSVSNAMVLYSLNHLIEEFLSYELPEDLKTVIRDYDTEIQEILVNTLVADIFPIIQNTDFLPKEEGGQCIFRKVLGAESLIETRKHSNTNPTE